MARGKSPVVVSDAGPLIHLDELRSLDLLEGDASVLIPAPVWREVQLHRPALILPESIPAEVIQQSAPTDEALQILFRSFDLHAGERAAIALALHHSAERLLCDDGAARLAAEARGLSVRGTVGLIVRAVRRGTRTLAEVRELLWELPRRNSLHISPALLERVQQQLPSA